MNIWGSEHIFKSLNALITILDVSLYFAFPTMFPIVLAKNVITIRTKANLSTRQFCICEWIAVLASFHWHLRTPRTRSRPHSPPVRTSRWALRQSRCHPRSSPLGQRLRPHSHQRHHEPKGAARGQPFDHFLALFD